MLLLLKQAINNLTLRTIMKLRKIHIEQYKILNNFDIDFTNNNEPQNLIVLAGINGSGKTTLFDYINHFFSTTEFLGKTDYIEVQEQNETTDKSFFYFKANEQNTEKTDEVIVEYINKLIFEEKLTPEKAYEEVNNIINNIFTNFDIKIQFDGLNRKKQVFFSNADTKELHISQLSSGEKELLTKIFTLYLQDIKDSLILIDEPENSLHPLWQNRLAPVYEKFALENNNQIILATHSPHIVGSVKKEQIRVLARKNDQIEVISEFAGSYGWQTEKILLEIFRTNEVRTVEIEKKIKQLSKLLTNNQHDTTKFKELYNELGNTLGFDDNDLILIRLETARKQQHDKD